MEPGNAQPIDPPLPPFPSAWHTPARRSAVPWNLLAAAVTIALAIKLFGPAWFEMFESASVRTLKELAILLLAMNAAIVMHEAGHLVMAIALDFDVLGGSLGPIRALRVHRSWSFQYSWNLFSGSVVVVPRRSDSSWRARMLAMVAGGPAATLLGGVVAGVLLVGFGSADPWLARFLATCVELNFFLFILGLFPNGSGSRLPNDARLFCSFLRNTPEANQILLYHLITSLQIAGVRPRDYPERVIRKLASAFGRPEMCFVYAHAIALWAVDRGDLCTADAWDKRALDLSDFCNVKIQNWALAASACFDVIFRDDVRAARGKFAEIQISMLSPPCFRYRIAAACWLAAGNIPAALAEIARARYAFPNRLPYYEFERMLLSKLHGKAVKTQPQELSVRSVSRATP